MAKAQKFGTFGGVFVPSILTILGVIMYLRLGWVVGEAGLVGAILIIILAHVVSVCTGLSVSSVATDQKVKAGGVYYMLSRSLGLPIGGSIGVALYVATALSIAMYVVGFSESFNGFIGITTLESTHAEQIQNLRITGSITLFIITAIALISTSLAIKTQYYILAAIALSLVSIFAGGFFMDHGFDATATKLFPGEDSPSLETIFAIFFPAVTGFTAGVAMSGDLKDPKKSIPVGTMLSIGVGLVVYILLAVFLSTNIDSAAMTEDYNILSKISLFSAYGSPLVLAGIWGATLSSALGGILGGPRILQAMSLDKVTPKIFGLGVGKSNEPRNALILTFFIAEAGILIGELDLIAPIVSMFYLTAYGFINLSSTLESWSGSNFRPTFKIPKLVSIIGAVATFAIMFKLDLISMIASFIAMGLIFLLLTRRQINLGYGDVWQGVWSEIIRTALFKVDRKAIDKRSWRPNILLFSGGTDKRPHLIEYGKKIVGRLGLLSNFDLIENPGLKLQFSKPEQALDSTENTKGIFSRRYQCKDIYAGIESIAETYGFSGIEPNTILMGWARYSPKPEKFAELIDKFIQLDYNLLIMDYDQEVGFGERKTIDIWWNGTGNNISCPLTVNRFLLTTDEWYKASIRVYIYADLYLADHAKIQYRMDQLLEELKINAEVNLVNLAEDDRHLNEIIKSTSKEADLIYLDLPPMNKENTRQFFSDSDALCKDIGTVILYQASSYFQEVGLNLKERMPDETIVSEDVQRERDEALLQQSHIELPPQKNAAELFENLNDQSKKIIGGVYDEVVAMLSTEYIHLISQIRSKTTAYLSTMKKQQGGQENVNNDLVRQSSLNTGFFSLLDEILEQHSKQDLESQTDLLLKSLRQIDEKFSDHLKELPKKTLVKFEKEEAQKDLKAFSWGQRLKSKVSKKPLNYALNNHHLASWVILQKGKENLINQVAELNRLGLQFNHDLRNTIGELIKFDNETEPNKKHHGHGLEEKLQNIEEGLKANVHKNKTHLFVDNNSVIQKAIYDLLGLKIKNIFKSELKSKKLLKLQGELLVDTISSGLHNQHMVMANTILDVKLLSFQNELIKQFDQFKPKDHDVTSSISQNISQKLRQFEKIKDDMAKSKSVKGLVDAEEGNTFYYKENFDKFQEELKNSLDRLPEQYKIADPKSLMNGNAEEVNVVSISPVKTVEYIMSENLIKPLTTKTDRLQMMVEKTVHIESDVSRAVEFTIENYKNEVSKTLDNKRKQEFIDTIAEEGERLQVQENDLGSAVDNYEKDISEIRKLVLSKLDGYAVIKSALDLNYILREQRKQQAIGKFASFRKSLKNKLQDAATNLYYRKSEGILAAKKMQGQKSHAASTEDFLKLITQVSPQKQVVDKLPLYYNQLFLHGQMIDRELWLLRKNDKLRIDEGINLYKSTRSGAILITGTAGSGKSLLSKMMTYKHFEAENTYTVDPPREGSTSAKAFNQAIKKSMRYYGDFNAIFDRIEKETAIIFNDLELWWERSDQGYEVIERIMEMVDRHSTKCLFIFNMNSHCFEFINQLNAFGNTFIKTIDIEPYNTEQIKQIILKRHRSSRLRFSLADVPEDKLGNLEMARLFSQIFNISKGNIGAALQAWITSMEEITDDGEIRLKLLKNPSVDCLNDLDAEKTIILAQILLHKSLSRERLQRIVRMDEKKLTSEINLLIRARIVEESAAILKINRYVLPHLREALTEDHII
ncbi:amino acid permease [Fulvivirgaceae bacterium BMA12]|uniref:Amino acid permease n=1 Tax=Agaribacillus aureus TaxID=3051825 RepID=A0ABT8L4S9_9BACT|nr:amino acid permease [Fulvivirgaceae bacterium BMA12]